MQSPIINITPMTLSDLDGVMAIEQTTLSPWSRSLFEEELANKQTFLFTAKHPSSNDICGFITGSLIIDEAEIRKFAVKKQFRCQGIGKQLLNRSFQFFKKHHIIKCFLELRESNLDALNVYHKAGFIKVGLRKSYYTKPCENAIILKKTL